MAIDHRLLNGVQPRAVGVEAFDGDQFLAIERRQELDARVDRPQGDAATVSNELCDDDRASTTIAFGATFLGTFTPEVLAQVLQHRARRRDVLQFMNLAVENETNTGIAIRS